MCVGAPWQLGQVICGKYAFRCCFKWSSQ